ncbi:MAG: hypothetical protein HWD61_11775 [Parachlamydiaceae bacterium]|nr:MAG: hypothetical protein HWD61_11775 [Parachlamydiaceae bacterium]
MQQAQNAELQNSITQLKAKMEEMQASFEQKMQQEKNHQEQLHESIRFAEGQVVKWEDKCLKAYEKLKILEEKHQQFQTLFSSLGNVMGVKSNLSTLTSISAPTSFKETMHFVELPKVKEEVIQEQRTLSSEPSLFEMEQKPRKNIRQNLFD